MKEIQHFGETYRKIQYPTLTDKVNLKDIEFIENILNLPEGSTILDIPCGWGRHAILLAGRGFKVTGVDSSSEFISIARENSKEIENVNFILEDMREINFANKFDAAVNLFTSFGYLSDQENLDFVKRIAGSLKKGGKFLIETVNREWMIKNIKENPVTSTIYPDKKIMMAKNTFNETTNRWFCNQILVENGQKYKQTQDTRLYSLEEFTLMLESSGMNLVAAYGNNSVYGNDYKEPYSTSHRNIIILAEKG